MNPQVTPHDASAAKPAVRAGVPVWRVGKPDAFLADAVDAARAALLEAVDPEQVGRHIAAKSEGERLVTHLFECLRSGYRGWQWFVTVARVSRSKVVTVSELGLLPSENSVLAPEWLPWSDRIRPEDREDTSEETDDDAAELEEADELDEAAEEEAEEAADAEAAGITDIDDEID